jgi:hypothetical protein
MATLRRLERGTVPPDLNCPLRRAPWSVFFLGIDNEMIIPNMPIDPAHCEGLSFLSP